MSAKEELDARIKAKIKPNGVGAIDGQRLQNTLLDINATHFDAHHPKGGSKELDFEARELGADKVITPEIVSPIYTGGSLGKGFRLYFNAQGNAVIESDIIQARKEAIFNVVTIAETRSVGAETLQTYASAVLVAVVDKQNAWRCYYDSKNSGQYWMVGDQAMRKTFTGIAGDTLKYYWRLVTAVGNEDIDGKKYQWIELSKEVAEGEGVPEVGDECVGLGHRGEDRRRKNAKLVSAFGEKGVEEISYANIDGFSLVGKETAYQSPERWRVRSNAFELVAGNGIVYPTVVERGAWSEAQAPYYYYDRVSHGGNIYLCIDKRLDGTTVEPATDQHAVWLCEVRKGDDGAKGDKGDQGAAAPRLKTQFSINGTTAWHDAYAAGDAYRRESNDNGVTWSVAMRMVGEGGTPGADGKKTPYTDFSYAYGLSQPTVWLDAPPSKVEGQHLWERIQKYTPKADNSGWALASTSYAIINEFVQIGGRNLLRNTSSDWQISHGVSNYYGDISQYRGKQMLIHFEHDNTDNQTVAYYELYINDVWTKDCVFPLDNSKIGINYQQNTFIVPDNAVTVRLVTYGSYGLFKTRNMMMEAGNKPADWTAAPEDVQAEIDASKTVIYAIKPSAEQVKKIVTTAASGATATSLLPSTLSVSVTRKKGNEDAAEVSSFAMKYFSNKGTSVAINAWPLDLWPIAKDWEWLDLVLYGDATYAKELTRKRIHINENANISGAEIAARINASGSEVQIEGERISVIGKMIQLNKMTVDVDGNATMNDVTMNNANVSGKVTASSGSIANMLAVSNNQLRSGKGMLNISEGKADATKPGLTRCDNIAEGYISMSIGVTAGASATAFAPVVLNNQTAGRFKFSVAVMLTSSYSGTVSIGMRLNNGDVGTFASGLVAGGGSSSRFVTVEYMLDKVNSEITFLLQCTGQYKGYAHLYLRKEPNALSPFGIYYDNRDKNIFQEFGVMHKYGNGQLYLTSLEGKDPEKVDSSEAEGGMVVGGCGFKVRSSGIYAIVDNQERCLSNVDVLYASTNVSVTDKYNVVMCNNGSAITVTLPANPTTGRMIYVHQVIAGNTVTINGNGKGIDATSSRQPKYTIQAREGVTVALMYDGVKWFGFKMSNIR